LTSLPDLRKIKLRAVVAYLARGFVLYRAKHLNIMTILKNQLNGRIQRRHFFVGWLLAIVVYFLAYAESFALATILGAPNSDIPFYITILFSFLTVGYVALLGVRRFHDMNASGLWALLLLLPGLSFIPSVILLLQKGTAGPNKYGDEPAKERGLLKVIIGITN